MKHLFLNYELSKLAEEKGFDEPCLASFYVFGDGIARNGYYGQTEPELKEPKIENNYEIY